MHQKAAGYPVGGFLELVRAIERRYLGSGGEIHYRSRVTRIPAENGQAIGVRLAAGAEHRADIVISAADGHSTIFDWLEGRHISDEIRGLYDTLPRYPPILFICLGVDRPFEEMPPVAAGDIFPLAAPVSIGGREYKWLTTHIYNFDPQVAPEGGTLVKVLLDADYDY
jgi:phytoene dehydrogenase-like protein